MVSEVGDHFNNIAVMSLAMLHAESGAGRDRGLSVARGADAGGRARSRACCSTGWIANSVMIASDMTRAVIALGFILCIHQKGDRG